MGTSGRDVVLRRAAEADRELVDRLLQLFLHDLSEFGSLQIGPDGRFDWGIPTAAWFDEPGREAYLIDVGAPVGLVLTSWGDEGRRIDAFFVLRAHRRRGLGRAIWPQIAATHAGSWELPVLAGNPDALAFARAGAAAIGSDGESRKVEDGEDTVTVRVLVE